MARRTLLITYVATYLVAIGTVVRYLTGFRDEHFWSIALLLGVYLILIFAEPVFIRRNRFLIYVYLFVQTAIVCTLATITPGVDFWATLFFPLVMLVMHNFAQQTGFLITGIFTMIMVIFMLLGNGLKVGLPLVFINGVVYFFLAAFIAILGDAINQGVRVGIYPPSD